MHILIHEYPNLYFSLNEINANHILLLQIPAMIGHSRTSNDENDTERKDNKGSDIISELLTHYLHV